MLYMYTVAFCFSRNYMRGCSCSVWKLSCFEMPLLKPVLDMCCQLMYLVYILKLGCLCHCPWHEHRSSWHDNVHCLSSDTHAYLVSSLCDTRHIICVPNCLLVLHRSIKRHCAFDIQLLSHVVRSHKLRRLRRVARQGARWEQTRATFVSCC